MEPLHYETLTKPGPPLADRLERLKRGTYVLTLLLVLAASSAGLVIGVLSGELSSAAAAFLFCSTSFCTITIWAVVAESAPLRLLEEAIYAVSGLLLVAVLVYGLYLAETAQEARLATEGVFLWAPVTYAIIFVARDHRSALGRCAVLFALILAISLPRATGIVLAADHPPIDASLFWQLYLSSAAVIAVLLFFGALKDRAIEVSAAAERMRTLADTDPLTGLPNRRRVESALSEELDRARRYDMPLSLVGFDLDDFKHINDTYGHDAGDSVLVAVCQAVQPRLRAHDLFGRWGGEEFVVLAPHVSLREGLRLAERIREDLKSLQLVVAAEVSASFGVATARPEDDLVELIKRADIALYRAKKAGKDRVEPEAA